MKKKKCEVRRETREDDAKKSYYSVGGKKSIKQCMESFTFVYAVFLFLFQFNLSFIKSNG